MGLRFRPTASSKVKQRVGKLQSAALRCHLPMGVFLYVLSAPLSVLTMEQALSLRFPLRLL